MVAAVENMFSVRERPWHDGTGKYVIQDYPGSWEEARKLSGLDWDPITTPAYDQNFEERNGVLVPTGFSPIPGYNQIKRSDTMERLAIKADSYSLITNTDMGEIIEAVLGTRKDIKWETAGVLNKGKEVWVLVKLEDPITVPGDFTPTVRYLAITNHHDGSGSCALRAVSVRIVCWNTFTAAEMEGARTGLEFFFRHTKNWRERVEDAKLAVTGADEQFARWKVQAEELMGIRVDAPKIEIFLSEFVPMPPEGAVSDRVIANVHTARQQIRDLLASPTTQPVAHTGYGLVQAAGEYLDHIRGTRASGSIMNRTMLKREPAKTKAVKLVRELANA